MSYINNINERIFIDYKEYNNKEYNNNFFNIANINNILFYYYKDKNIKNNVLKQIFKNNYKEVVNKIELKNKIIKLISEKQENINTSDSIFFCGL